MYKQWMSDMYILQSQYLKAKPAPIAVLSYRVCHMSSSVIPTQQFCTLNDTYQQIFRLSGLLVKIKRSVTQRHFGEMKIVIPLVF